MGRPPSVSQDKFIIRLPDGMRERIKEAADANGRTMTAEIVWRLEKSLTTVETRLDDLGAAINTTADLAYDTHEHGWDTNGRVLVLEAFAKAVSAQTGIAVPSLDDLTPAEKSKRKKG
jgi:predicted DNA-binding protein